MSRAQKYASAAERQKAYRNRQKRAEASAPTTKRTRPASRPARLAVAITALVSLKTEYETWKDQIPDFSVGSEQEDRVIEAIEALTEAIDLLSDLQLPRGFGRD